jgi:hypothetical protein
MSFFRMPTFIMKTPTWSDEDVKAHTRPLDKCPDRHYVETVQTWPKEDGEVSNARH